MLSTDQHADSAEQSQPGGATTMKETPSVFVGVADTAYPTIALVTSCIRKCLIQTGHVRQSVVSVPLAHDDNTYATLPLAESKEWLGRFFRAGTRYLINQPQEFQIRALLSFVSISGEYEEQLLAAGKACTICVGLFMDTQKENYRWFSIDAFVPVPLNEYDPVLLFPISPSFVAGREMSIHPVTMHNLGLIQQATAEAYIAANKGMGQMLDITRASPATLEVMKQVHHGLERACNLIPFSSPRVM